MDARLAALGLSAVLVIALLAWGARRVSRRAGELHDKPMRLLDHIRELRYRVIASLAVTAGFMVALFSFTLDRVTIAGRALWLPVPALADSFASRGLDLLLRFSLPDGVQVAVFSPSEAIVAQFQAAIIGGLVLASPFVAYHVGAFIAPALHPKERRFVARLAPIAFVLFLAGVAFGVLVLAPITLAALYSFAEPLGAEQFAQPGQIVSFVTILALLFGAAFELPLVMAGLAYAGLVSPGAMGRHWRGVIVGVLIAAAVGTPDPSPLSQLLISVPMLLLYGIGLLAARMAWGVRRAREDRPDATPDRARSG